MTYIDPVEVAGDHYSVMFENEHVRVLEMKLGAGEIDVEHSHPSETIYFLSGGKIRFHLSDGEKNEVEVSDHSAMWHEPWTHTVENIGDTNIHAILVEAKV